MKTIDTEKLTQAPATDGIWEILDDTKEYTFNTDIQEATTVEQYVEEYPKMPLDIAYDKVDELNEEIISSNARVLREMSEKHGEAYAQTIATLYEAIASDIYRNTGDFGIAGDPTYMFAEIGLLRTVSPGGIPLVTFEEMISCGSLTYNIAYTKLGGNIAFKDNPGNDEAARKLYNIFYNAAKERLL